MSLHAASVPAFLQILDALSGVLRKAEAHADARKIPHEVMLGLRLAPDMFALAKQVQVACDFAKNTAGRLAGVDLPRFPDDEASFAELQERIAKTRGFVAGLPASAFAGDEKRPITFPDARQAARDAGGRLSPQLRATELLFPRDGAYAILRANGVDLGKGDYMGKVEELKAAG